VVLCGTNALLSCLFKCSCWNQYQETLCNFFKCRCS